MHVMLSTFWHGSPGMLARSSGTVSVYTPARRQYCGAGEDKGRKVRSLEWGVRDRELGAIAGWTKGGNAAG